MSTPNVRGIVLGSSWRLLNRTVEWGGPGVFTPRPGGDGYLPQLESVEPVIRSSLLYFDRIEWPSNTILPQGEVSGLKTLTNSGVLRRSLINAKVANPTPESEIILTPEYLTDFARRGTICAGDLGRVAEQIDQAHQYIFTQLEQRERGVWSFAPIGFGLDFPDSKAFRGAEVGLYNCLPVPDDDVPFEEILDFKRVRNPELLALRSEMDEMYLTVSNSADPARELNIAAGKVDKAMADVYRTMHDASLAGALKTMHTDVQTIVSAAAIGMAVGEAVPLPLVGKLLVGGAAAYTQLKSRAVQSPIERLGPFKYVYDLAREGIIDSRALVLKANQS